MKRSLPATGFTIIELLVAMAIFSLIATAGYSGLSNIISFQKAQQDAQERKENIELALLVMARDFYQIAPRTVRSNEGNFEPAMLFDSNNKSIFFTRIGSVVPYFSDASARFRRSRMLRVGYVLEGSELYRYHYYALDRSLSTVPRKTLMLRNVDTFDVRFLRPDLAWSSFWQPEKNALEKLPVALEVKIRFDNATEYTHLFPIIEPPLK